MLGSAHALQFKHAEHQTASPDDAQARQGFYRNDRISLVRIRHERLACMSNGVVKKLLHLQGR